MKLPVLVDYVKQNVKVTKNYANTILKVQWKLWWEWLKDWGRQVYTKSLFHCSPNHYDKEANEIRFTTIFLVKLFHYANFLDVFKATKMR